MDIFGKLIILPITPSLASQFLTNPRRWLEMHEWVAVIRTDQLSPVQIADLQNYEFNKGLLSTLIKG